MSPFLFSGEFFKRAEGVGFKKGKRIKVEKMAQSKERDGGDNAHDSDFNSQGNKSVERGG